ncbi:MAG: MarC family protein [Bacteroidales bacterium]|jgi:multiple antibiotic resistance protein|nr:MarC family protein [Bacteroidales bacterium]MCI2121289.1 MarC family protein [Bacteroidales bacterium]MCI2145221.1 MarC family protein [Bacteroidales bacterium]
MGLNISIKEIFSSFMVLFAIVDITGSLPILLDLKSKGKSINAFQASFSSLIIGLVFLFLGEPILGLFGVDISSFAVAGALIILMLAFEMIFGVEIFHNDSPTNSATVVPVVFPLIVGTGTLTTLLALRAEYSMINIVIAFILNMAIVYVVLLKLDYVEKFLGKGTIYILRKFFGLILLAIGIKLFTTNIVTLI